MENWQGAKDIGQRTVDNGHWTALMESYGVSLARQVLAIPIFCSLVFWHDSHRKEDQIQEHWLVGDFPISALPRYFSVAKSADVG